MNKLLKNNKDGFTLLEVLFSIVILSVGLLGLAAMQMTAIKGNTYGNKLSIATELIENQMEAFRNTPFDQIDDITLAPVAGYEYYQREAVVQDNTPLADAKTITVTVKWTDTNGPKTHEISVKTIMTN